jgi:hypothetical protein
MAFRSRCCDLTLSFMAGLLSVRNGGVCVLVFPQQLNQQFHHLAAHFRRKIPPQRPRGRRLKQIALRQQRAVWRVHQHLLRFENQDADPLSRQSPSHTPAIPASFADASSRPGARSAAPSPHRSHGPASNWVTPKTKCDHPAPTPHALRQPIASAASESMSTAAQTTDASDKTPPTRYREHSFVSLYNKTRSHMERDHLPPIHEAPEEVPKLDRDQIVVRSYVGGLVKSFERKAA